MKRLDFDLPKRTRVLPTIAEISHIFDARRRTSTLPAGPLERDHHSPTLHLVYNVQGTVVHAYEIALSSC